MHLAVFTKDYNISTLHGSDIFITGKLYFVHRLRSSYFQDEISFVIIENEYGAVQERGVGGGSSWQLVEFNTQEDLDMLQMLYPKSKLLTLEDYIAKLEEVDYDITWRDE